MKKNRRMEQRGERDGQEDHETKGEFKDPARGSRVKQDEGTRDEEASSNVDKNSPDHRCSGGALPYFLLRLHVVSGHVASCRTDYRAYGDYRVSYLSFVRLNLQSVSLTSLQTAP